ncbi:hypothetical protein BV25DRAFT_999806 [Artomyces pyxidatus]|uniref:Uncharacterized protein n=1 Tax=Artomyces pyxidatus TaxID=48021 RepID=A0ACB8SVL5_9AGAM|nr:hypothetical protein BV25DRAFT_999806 [Artomyces pyxidatus]
MFMVFRESISHGVVTRCMHVEEWKRFVDEKAVEYDDEGAMEALFDRLRSEIGMLEGRSVAFKGMITELAQLVLSVRDLERAAVLSQARMSPQSVSASPNARRTAAMLPDPHTLPFPRTRQLPIRAPVRNSHAEDVMLVSPATRSKPARSRPAISETRARMPEQTARSEGDISPPHTQAAAEDRLPPISETRARLPPAPNTPATPSRIPRRTIWSRFGV